MKNFVYMIEVLSNQYPMFDLWNCEPSLFSFYRYGNYIFTWLHNFVRLLGKNFIAYVEHLHPWYLHNPDQWQTWITGFVSWKKLDKLNSTLVAYKWHLFKVSFPVKVAFSLEGNKFPSKFILFTCTFYLHAVTCTYSTVYMYSCQVFNTVDCVLCVGVFYTVRRHQDLANYQHTKVTRHEGEYFYFQSCLTMSIHHNLSSWMLRCSKSIWYFLCRNFLFLNFLINNNVMHTGSCNFDIFCIGNFKYVWNSILIT